MGWVVGSGGGVVGCNVGSDVGESVGSIVVGSIVVGSIVVGSIVGIVEGALVGAGVGDEVIGFGVEHSSRRDFLLLLDFLHGSLLFFFRSIVSDAFVWVETMAGSICK